MEIPTIVLVFDGYVWRCWIFELNQFRFDHLRQIFDVSCYCVIMLQKDRKTFFLAFDIIFYQGELFSLSLARLSVMCLVLSTRSIIAG